MTRIYDEDQGKHVPFLFGCVRSCSFPLCRNVPFISPGHICESEVCREPSTFSTVSIYLRMISRSTIAVYCQFKLYTCRLLCQHVLQSTWSKPPRQSNKSSWCWFFGPGSAPLLCVFSLVRSRAQLLT